MLILKLDFLETAFNNIRVKAQELNTEKEKLKKHINDTLSALAAKIEEQLTEQLKKQYTKEAIKIFAHEILRREHIEYLSKLYPKDGIIKKFIMTDDKHVEHKYTSSQVSIGKPRNCYHRWGTNEPDPNDPDDPNRVGLSAFRKHTLEKNGIAKPLIEYYHHASPVVYEEPDFQKRIKATEANLKQAVRKTGGGPLTEVRLLSTNKGPGGDYKQAFQTYLAAIRASTEDEPITVFFYGVNIARFASSSASQLFSFNIPGYSGGLQTFINTRSTNTLFEKIFNQLGIQNGPVLSAIKGQRTLLDAEIKKIDLSEGEKFVEKKLRELLEKHHKLEEKLLKQYKEIMKTAIPLYDENQKLIYADTITLLKLMENNRYLKPKYNGQLQATLVRLNARLGEHVATGCNDAKDRDGMVSIVVEANEIYRDRHGCYPDITHPEKGPKIRQELRLIQHYVCKYSTPAKVAEAVSWFGVASGLDNTNQPLSGFGHLPNDGSMAGFFKVAHHDFYGDHSKNVKNIKLPPYRRQTPEDLIQKKSSSSAEFDVSTKDKNHNPGNLLKTFEFIEKTHELKPIDTHTEDPDATPVPHRIEVYEHAVRYQPNKMPTNDALLKKIVEKSIQEAIDNFKPKPKNVDDLQFNGNRDMVRIAKEIAPGMFKPAKPEFASQPANDHSLVI